MTSNKNLHERKIEKYFQFVTDDPVPENDSPKLAQEHKEEDKIEPRTVEREQIENADEMEDMVEDLTKQDRFYSPNVCNICYSKGKLSSGRPKSTDSILFKEKVSCSKSDPGLPSKCEHVLFFEQLEKMNPFQLIYNLAHRRALSYEPCELPSQVKLDDF